jgi:hypothetical protein
VKVPNTQIKTTMEGVNNRHIYILSQH